MDRPSTGPWYRNRDTRSVSRTEKPIITPEAKAWVINVACTKPKEYGYAAEIWTHSKLAEHTRKHAPTAGHDCLKKAAKATIQRILKEHSLQPHKVKYYLEKEILNLIKNERNIMCLQRNQFTEQNVASYLS